MNNPERKEKQEYLRQSIIDKGVPAEVFEDYLLHMKPDALDIDNWTQAELSRVVDLFYENAENNKVSKLMNESTLTPPPSEPIQETLEHIEVVQ